MPDEYDYHRLEDGRTIRIRKAPSASTPPSEPRTPRPTVPPEAPQGSREAAPKKRHSSVGLFSRNE
jgi:hypothetical protein